MTEHQEESGSDNDRINPQAFLQDLISTSNYPLSVTQVFTIEDTGIALRRIKERN